MSLVKKKPNRVVVDDWCDDCAICTFMRESETLGRVPSIEEMNKVFAKQNSLNLAKSKKN